MWIPYALKLNFCDFCGSGAICKYFNPWILGQRRCITVKMDVEWTRAQCPIVLFLPLHRLGIKYDRCFVDYQLIIQFFWCEASNNVDSFVLYGQAARCARVGNCGFFFCGRGNKNWSEVDNRYETHCRRRRQFDWEQKGRLREDCTQKQNQDH